jgi:hypothetical protein
MVEEIRSHAKADNDKLQPSAQRCFFSSFRSNGRSAVVTSFCLSSFVSRPLDTEQNLEGPWPELVGVPAADAEQILRALRPDLTIQLIHQVTTPSSY